MAENDSMRNLMQGKRSAIKRISTEENLFYGVFLLRNVAFQLTHPHFENLEDNWYHCFAKF